jgi:hypothetical protein
MHIEVSSGPSLARAPGRASLFSGEWVTALFGRCTHFANCGRRSVQHKSNDDKLVALNRDSESKLPAVLYERRDGIKVGKCVAELS